MSTLVFHNFIWYQSYKEKWNVHNYTAELEISHHGGRQWWCQDYVDTYHVWILHVYGYAFRSIVWKGHLHIVDSNLQVLSDFIHIVSIEEIKFPQGRDFWSDLVPLVVSYYLKDWCISGIITVSHKGILTVSLEIVLLGVKCKVVGITPYVTKALLWKLTVELSINI